MMSSLSFASIFQNHNYKLQLARLAESTMVSDLALRQLKSSSKFCATRLYVIYIINSMWSKLCVCVCVRVCVYVCVYIYIYAHLLLHG